MSKYEVIRKIMESKIQEDDKVYYIEMFLNGLLVEREIERLWKDSTIDTLLKEKRRK